jgi:hypothetical protein
LCRNFRRGPIASACLAAIVLALSLAGVLIATAGAPRAVAQGSSGEPVAQTDDSVPASDVTMIGSTPDEAGGGAGETWGIGRSATEAVPVRYTHGEWGLAPGLRDENGNPLTEFELDTPEAIGSSSGPSPLAGQMTSNGAGVLGGYVHKTRQVLLVRDPDGTGNAFQETNPGAESQLEAGERLFSFTRAPLLAPLDEGGGHGGALVVPVKERNFGIEESVLHWDGASREWRREKIELPSDASSSEFRVLGIGASSPTNAWLLAQLSAGEVALFHRHVSGSEATWQSVALKSGGEEGEPVKVDGDLLTIPGAQKDEVRNQVLTVTSQGVWIDGERSEARASTTIFFKPEGAGGPSLSSWCTVSPGAEKCDHELPENLPTGPSRSIAWASSSSFGERVITGLPEGVSLRLEGESFKRVLALGGSVGSTYGAAFSSPREGWLGNFQLPVHITLEPSPSVLSPWPVSFRHALVAVAPQPDAPVGALDSEALAVGDLGEVARYQPGKGWLPESLLGSGGRREEPRLRAVAWPTPSRVYAVGDEGAMWLWRGETGLWEPDPAAPYNFRGNLLGVAFDPNNPARGYAVGESGVLLSYGKTWTQESLPAEVANASFTSIAFAGSEAIVAYRILPNADTNRYKGGLLVNEGSGWHVDQGAAEAMGSGVPWAVAGLPDGGAAFSASGVVYEREGPGDSWHATSTPFPGGGEPGSLAPFREGSSLRVVASGSVPDTYDVEKEPEAPPGLPPTLIKPYPLPTNRESGVLRQTANGWVDEVHELNNVKEPPGDWTFYDIPYQPDPVSAVLVAPTGPQGWAIGGQVEEGGHEGVLDTADVDRFGGEATTPPGVGTAPLSSTSSTIATFAIGGNAQCAAPCAERANARLGPDVWLSTALEHAAIPGVRAFFYTGPRLVSPKAISGPKESADEFSYEEELGRYASLLGGSPLPAYGAGTPTDLDDSSSELSFEQAFKSLASPFGEGAAAPGLPAVNKPTPCGATPGCQSAYYSLESSGAGGTVRVIVLDDTTEIGAQQLTWLGEQLGYAKAANTPAIVVGNADLNAEIAAGGHPGAGEVVRVLIEGQASAYFFDSPEENIKEPLSYGGESIEAFGSGTLGYVNYQAESSGEFLGASGFLLAHVSSLARTDNSKKEVTNRAAVTVELIPNIGELAMEAQGGTLLRRSQAARFAALARRPRAGNRSARGGTEHPETDPYIPIPSECVGTQCANGLLPEYEFISSEPRFGKFVEPNLNSAEKNAVLLNSKEEPIVDKKSGLFCALNPGTTIVTIKAGGLSASLPVTVQPGSVRRPCGTTPLGEHANAQQAVPVPPPAPAPAPAPAGPSPTPTPVPVPPPPAAVVTPVTPAAHAVTPPAAAFFLPAVANAPLFAVLPPPIPTPARPTPPSGTSAVTSPVEAPEKEEEKEEATESVSNQAVAYHSSEHEPAPLYLIGILVLAAFAGASVRRRPRRGGRELRVAPATVSAQRAQRRISSRSDRRY